MHKAWVLIFLLLFTACTPQSSQTVTTIQATLNDTSIRPGLARIPGGQNITMQLSNTGTAPHSWVLLKDPPSEPFSADDEANILFQVTLDPSESRTVQFRAPAAPGEYSVASRQLGDLEKGLTAKVLVVQPGY